MLDTSKQFKNYFLTYDTSGQDWTIRLWDLNKGDSLVTSFTCPSRIVCCDVNIAPFSNANNPANSSSSSSQQQQQSSAALHEHSHGLSAPNSLQAEANETDCLLLAVALYAFKGLLVLKLLSSGSSSTGNPSSRKRSSISSGKGDSSYNLSGSALIQRDISL